MTRVISAATARVRVLLALALCSVIALMLPSLVATGDSPSAVAFVAAAVVLGAGWGLSRHVAAFASRALPPMLRAADQVRCLLTDRATDPAHHPLRPRAPGLV